LAQCRTSVQALERAAAAQAPELARLSACQDQQAKLERRLAAARAAEAALEEAAWAAQQRAADAAAALGQLRDDFRRLEHAHEQLQGQHREAQRLRSVSEGDAEQARAAAAELRATVDQLAHSKQVGQLVWPRYF
jgi:chromosome segregation ATPase